MSKYGSKKTLGSVLRKLTFGLYSALRACKAMVFRSKRQSRLTVATMFLDKACEYIVNKMKVSPR